MPAKHEGRSLYVAFERNGRCMRAILFGATHGGFYAIYCVNQHGVFVEHIEGAFFYILENFEEFLSISGRENALRVSRLVNILCRNLLAKIQPSPPKTGMLAFERAIGYILFPNKML